MVRVNCVVQERRHRRGFVFNLSALQGEVSLFTIFLATLSGKCVPLVTAWLIRRQEESQGSPTSVSNGMSGIVIKRIHRVSQRGRWYYTRKS